MPKKKWLTRAHFDLMGRIRFGFPRDGEWVRKMPGMNARSVRLLIKIGLMEGRVTMGPRGGRIVWYRLTADGMELTKQIQAEIEGTIPVDTKGNVRRRFVTRIHVFEWGNV